MAHYAILDNNNIVTQVIVGKDENETLPEGFTSWEQYYGGKRTSYNTLGNQHSGNGTPFRGNYAGIGYKYDISRDAFIPPKPYATWVLNEETFLWQAPTAMPVKDGYRYYWDDITNSWYEVLITR
jgi:hypothetical protein